MPVLKGFEQREGQNVALMDFPDARKFTAKPGGGWDVSPNPHTLAMTRDDLERIVISAAKSGNQDTSPFVDALSKMEAMPSLNAVEPSATPSSVSPIGPKKP